MNPIQSIFLGLIQGLTEFLPISSSAHLILLRPIFGLGQPDLWFDVFLHGGTLLAVLLFMIPRYTRLWKKPVLIGKILLATVPAAAFGILLESTVENLVRNSYGLITTLLILVGIIFLLVRERGDKQLEDMGWSEALLIGIAQALALFPGVSRSGITLLIALLLGFRREDAVLFSFFLSITTIGGTFIKGFLELQSAGRLSMSMVLPGFITSFLSGLLACYFLLRIVQTHDLKPFGYYRILFGASVFIYFLFIL
jgi:undecaprenyl-diphosphatase